MKRTKHVTNGNFAADNTPGIVSSDLRVKSVNNNGNHVELLKVSKTDPDVYRVVSVPSMNGRATVRNEKSLYQATTSYTESPVVGTVSYHWTLPDGTSYIGDVIEIDFVPLPIGSHVVSVVAVDELGNASYPKNKTVSKVADTVLGSIPDKLKPNEMGVFDIPSNSGDVIMIENVSEGISLSYGSPVTDPVEFAVTGADGTTVTFDLKVTNNGTTTVSTETIHIVESVSFNLPIDMYWGVVYTTTVSINQDSYPTGGELRVYITSMSKGSVSGVTYPHSDGDVVNVVPSENSSNINLPSYVLSIGYAVTNNGVVIDSGTTHRTIRPPVAQTNDLEVFINGDISNELPRCSSPTLRLSGVTTPTSDVISVTAIAESNGTIVDIGLPSVLSINTDYTLTMSCAESEDIEITFVFNSFNNIPLSSVRLITFTVDTLATEQVFTSTGVFIKPDGITAVTVRGRGGTRVTEPKLKLGQLITVTDGTLYSFDIGGEFEGSLNSDMTVYSGGILEDDINSDVYFIAKKPELQGEVGTIEGTYSEMLDQTVKTNISMLYGLTLEENDRMWSGSMSIFGTIGTVYGVYSPINLYRDGKASIVGEPFSSLFVGADKSITGTLPETENIFPISQSEQTATVSVYDGGRVTFIY